MCATAALSYCSDIWRVQYDSAWAWRDGRLRDDIEGYTIPTADCRMARLRSHHVSALRQGQTGACPTCLSDTTCYGACHSMFPSVSVTKINGAPSTLPSFTMARCVPL